MTKTIYLKSKLPSLIQYDNQEFLLSCPHQFITINLEKTTYVKYYPISNKNFNPDIARVITLDCKNLKKDNLTVTKFDDSHFEILINPTPIVTKPMIEKKKKITLGLETLTITLNSNNTSTITISNQTVLFVHFVEFELKDLEASIINGYITIQCKNQDKIYLLIVETENYSIIEEKLFDSIEMDEKMLRGFLKQEDMAKHGLIVSYEFTKPIKIEKKMVYINNAPDITKNEILIPYAFFEAVKVDNYRLARHYLSKDLAKKLDDEHLKEFFGDFVDIRQNVYNKSDDFVCLVYKNQDEFYVQNYKCLIQNCKIINILQA